MKTNKIPKHVGIILDGNRRFSKKLMLKPWMGHEWGAKKVEKLLEWACDLDIKELTLYAFSYENFNRPKKEFNFLMDLFSKEFERLKHDKRVKERKIRINFIGRIWMFPKEIQEKMEDIMEDTKAHNGYLLNIAMAYGGRTEVIDAVRKISEQIKNDTLKIEDINEESFSRCLYMKDEPDLIIRTGGNHRTSNFLIWQAAYSEYFFLEKTWPEFEKEDLVTAIKNFSKQHRRFGK